MPKYRKKPVVIDALQYIHDSDGLKYMAEFMGGECMTKPGDDGAYQLHIETLEGTMKANNGDWIIKGVKGEYYPCKPDIFHATYEQVI